MAWVKSRISWAVCGCFWIFPTDAPVICPSPNLPLEVSARAACRPIAPVCPWEAQCRWAPWVHSLAPPTWHPAPLAKPGDVLEAAVYSAPFSLSNGASHFHQRLLRCCPAARQQRAQQGLPGPLQPSLLRALCREPQAAQHGCSPRSACSRAPRLSASARGAPAPLPGTARVLG